MDSGERTEAELALAWQAGEVGAFDAVYRAFAARLFGTAVGLVGDRHAAGDVAHDTFLRAATRIGTLRDPSRLRPWLFAILRNEATSWHRSRSRSGGGLDDGPAPVSEWLADDAPSPDLQASRHELADLVWTAADGLQPRDREVLELHLRGGLEAADLAQVMGVTPGHAAVLLSRMRDRLERCLGAVLIARSGRADCAALDRLLDGWDGRFSLAVRGTVVRHIESCPTCGRRRAGLVSLQHLAPVIVPPVFVLPDDLHARLVADLSRLGGPGGAASGTAPGTASGSSAAPASAGWAWRDDGFPWPAVDPELEYAVSDGIDGLDGLGAPVPHVPVARGSHPEGEPAGRRRSALVVAAAVVLLLAAVGVVVRRAGERTEVALADGVPPSASALAFPGAGESAASSGTATGPSIGPSIGSAAGQPAGAATGTAVPAGTAAPTPSIQPPTSSGPRGSGTPSASGATPSVVVTSSRPTPPSVGSVPATPTPSPDPSPSRVRPSPSPSDAPPQILRVSVNPATVLQSGCTPASATVAVVVRGAAPITGTVRWQAAKGQFVTTALTSTGTGLSGRVGPFAVAGRMALSVTVQDVQGRSASAATSVTVGVCSPIG